MTGWAPNNSALKHKINLDHPHRSNSPIAPSELLHIPFAFDHSSTGVTAISTINTWKVLYHTDMPARFLKNKLHLCQLQSTYMMLEVQTIRETPFLGGSTKVPCPNTDISNHNAIIMWHPICVNCCCLLINKT